MINKPIVHSCIYQGEVFHQRFTPCEHKFSYKIFFLAIDFDELPQLAQVGRIFKTDRFAPLRFFAPDYLGNKTTISKQDIWNKVIELGGQDLHGRVLFVGQMRCFGLYFSPINTYYCYDERGECRYLLAEVSNTPWNERHYYLINLQTEQMSEKAFHVSPFMDLEMKYHWRIKPPSTHLSLSIESRTHAAEDDKFFRANIAMTRQAFNNKNLLKNVLSIPMMTLKTVVGIYWQALKLYAKGVPYIAHSKKDNSHVS